MTAWYRSIRLRVALILMALIAVLGAVNGVTVDVLAARAARTQLRTQAVDELTAAIATYDITGFTPAGASLGAEGSPPGLVGSLRPGRASTQYTGRTMWAASRRPDGKVLTVRVPDSALRRQRAHLHSSLAWAAASVGVLGGLLGWVAAGSVTLRLRRAAQRFGAAGSHEVVAGDEVELLVERVESLTAELGARLDREREFAADVAHELRTPMTALVSAAELLPEDEVSTRVRRQVLRLRHLVEDLLELARAERDDVAAALPPADLGAVVRRVLVEFPEARLVVRGAVGLRVDDGVVERLVANLVANAFRHGRRPVTVELEQGRLTVRDHGDGFPAVLIAEGPRRFAAHGRSAGSGLGLSICAALAHRSGARLELRNDREGAVAAIVWDQPHRKGGVDASCPPGTASARLPS